MKKVLIITYYWPPAGGPGVQRVLKFAKYLPEFGWQPVILTVKNGEYPAYDESLRKDIPDSCKVYKTPALEPFSLYKKFTGMAEDEQIPTAALTEKKTNWKKKVAHWIRLNLFVPDARIGWIRNIVKEGMKIIEKENPDIIFSSSPPHSLQIGAKKLAKKSGLKWVADFRDPWMEISYYQNYDRNNFTKTIDKWLEKMVLNSADEIISISSGIVNILQSKIDNGNFHILPNGYDNKDFENIIQQDNKTFTISYAGFLSKKRIPFALIDALQKIKKYDKINNFKLQFIGNVCNELILLLKKKNIYDQFKFINYCSHKEALKYLMNSDILLLIIDDISNNKGFLTGKIFDYFGCKKPIFAIGPIDGDANKILKKTDSGKMINYNDVESGYTILKNYYTNWKTRKIYHKFNVKNYERKSLTKELANIFKKAIK